MTEQNAKGGEIREPVAQDIRRAASYYNAFYPRIGPHPEF